MKSSKTKTNELPNWRKYRYWIICIVLLLGLPFLLYYGYCWGWWGRHSLLLQYLFQCNCSLASEGSRYPDDVDVLVPACRNVNAGVRLSPNGRFLYFHDERNGLASAYLLDLQTRERIIVNNQPFSSFLTDDLLFFESGLDDDIINRTTGEQYSIRTFRYWRENAYADGEPNLELLVNALRQAKYIFFTQNNDSVIVLMSDFPTNFEQNFTFDRSDIPGGDANRVEHFLQENQVVYETILADFPHEAVSPDGRLIARDDGIYIAATNQIITKVPHSLVRGWTGDGRGAIYSSSRRCLIRIGSPFAEDTGCVMRVPQPVIILKVPDKYLEPAQTP